MRRESERETIVGYFTSHFTFGKLSDHSDSLLEIMELKPGDFQKMLILDDASVSGAPSDVVQAQLNAQKALAQVQAEVVGEIDNCK